MLLPLGFSKPFRALQGLKGEPGQIIGPDGTVPSGGKGPQVLVFNFIATVILLFKYS